MELKLKMYFKPGAAIQNISTCIPVMCKYRYLMNCA